MNGMKKATLWGLGLAVPFVLVATLDWAFPAPPHLPAAETYLLGEAIFETLGAPLTLLVSPLFSLSTGREFYVYADHGWVVPLYDVLFLAQWIVWAQFVRLIAIAVGSKRKAGAINHTSDGIRQPADESPKPSR